MTETTRSLLLLCSLFDFVTGAVLLLIRAGCAGGWAQLLHSKNCILAYQTILWAPFHPIPGNPVLPAAVRQRTS
ncbi:MAG: hypothetical protein JXA13_17370 [Anaerolineales bacterium]|nr:hypothetical protein [Anaerolineales bacterium]